MPVRLPRPEVVFFDLFGTLLRWSKSPRDAVAEALATLGHPVDPAEVYRRQREMERLFPPRDEHPAENEWQYWRHYDGELLSKLGVPSSKEALAAIRAEFERSVSLELAPDAVPTLQGLKDAHGKIGIISNATYGMLRDFDRLGLGKFFD